MAAESTIVPAPSETFTAFIADDGTLTYHLTAAFVITAGKATPVYYPEPPKGAKRIDPVFGEGFALGEIRGSSPQHIAQQVRERVQ